MRRWLLLLALCGMCVPGRTEAVERERLCHYEYKLWNKWQDRVIATIRVAKPRSELDSFEIGPYGCTPCEEDQTRTTLSNGLGFVACKKVAKKLAAALETAMDEGAVIESVSGYRPVMTRGSLDAHGNRTEFSRHAFGVALDVNAGYNGYYLNCAAWGPQCKLYKGGRYKPGDFGSIVDGDAIVTRLESIGLLWGGRMRGAKKDFMHFSPSGD